ncbi:tRNA (5-methylaminomethyl-2-thiouridine)(34)-methyltransferase MnmD [Larkinella soli]|uniref:tRNA (5-methylaminomethyl-2-thiouridine)(34)-methyltransferase MnmD n=1 Tax=Larkinella soli TaxID=1770527 RepID=UPI000FFBF684|nr:tRNA (5-methylaminomethyl-2-thiouridine)(34)-methyltransferase MnmD [Larkinella soli]
MTNPENKTGNRIVLTADGSTSVYNAAVDQHYHSIFGALQESQRVFIELGLYPALERFGEVRVFEMGFGTGLNALLTLSEAEKAGKPVRYTAVEAYPLPEEEAGRLNFGELLGSPYLKPLHAAPWNRRVEPAPGFSLLKQGGFLQDFQTGERFNLVYYDAFAPEAQPELWTEEIFQKVAGWMNPGGILTTYCSKGYVQRNLKAAGFSVEKHPGPARKREVLRAVREG